MALVGTRGFSTSVTTRSGGRSSSLMSRDFASERSMTAARDLAECFLAMSGFSARMASAMARADALALHRELQGEFTRRLRALPRDENGTMTLPAIDGENFFI